MTLHCWEDGPDICKVCRRIGCGEHTDDFGWPDTVGSTCMLERNHREPHEWTPDDTITVKFKLSDCHKMR